MASARLAISALFLVKKKFEDLKNILVQDTEYRNWEIVDEGYHSLKSDRIEMLKDIGSTYNVKYSVHAPFSSINIAEPDPRLSQFFTSFLEDSLQGSYTLGAEYFIIHPGRLTPFTYFFPEKGFSTLVTVLNKLLDTSKNLGVKLVLENMMGPYDFFTDLTTGLKIAEKVPGIGFCIDSGHANITENLLDLLDGLPNIQYLHIHDNDGTSDTHLAVGEGNIRWHTIKDTLKKREFKGWITAENYEQSHAYKSLSYFKDIRARSF